MISKTFPDMTERDWQRLDTFNRIQALQWEIEKANIRKDWTPEQKQKAIAEIASLNQSLLNP
jgi:hypothetical protein